jgi:nucleoside-diphosphate-sugar epimerase
VAEPTALLATADFRQRSGRFVPKLGVMTAVSGTVLVTGVSGAVGPALALRLAEQFRVRVLVRSDEQASRAVAAGWWPVFGDLREPETLADAVAGVDVVVHSAASLGSDWAVGSAVNVDGTRLLADAARAQGVGRFVHISTMSVHGEPQPDGLSENSPLALGEQMSAYVATKARAEAALSQLCDAEFAVTVLRPGAICSLRSSHWGDRLIHRLAKDGWPSHRHPDDVIPWVHTEDLAEMVALCATEAAAANNVYLAVDANVSIGEMFVPICEALGVPIQAPARAPVISRCRIGKIRRDLGYSPRHDFEETVAELVAYASALRSSVTGRPAGSPAGSSA